MNEGSTPPQTEAQAERPYHHGYLRAELLRRAWNSIELEGAEGLSLRAMAREAGVSHGASARHFKDKQALLDALATLGFERLNQTFRQIFAQPKSFEANFRMGALAYIQFAVTHPNLLRLMYGAKQHPDASAELKAASCAALQTLTNAIAQAQQGGEVRAGQPLEIALIAFANFHGVATLAIGDLLQGTSWEDAAALSTQFTWRGLAPDAQEKK